MKRTLQLLVWGYVRLIKLYPSRYRAEYGQELHTVFKLVISDAARSGWPALMGTAFYELSHVPGALLREHRRERNKATVTPSVNNSAGRWPEQLAAITPFLLVGTVVIILTNGNDLHAATPTWLENGLMGATLAVLLLLPLIGLFRGLPRWALPYLGGWFTFLLYLISVTRLDPWVSNLANPGGPWLMAGLYRGRIWVALLALAAGLVLVAKAWPPLSRFYDRIRGDWTLLSFGLYGATLMAVLLTFDDYVREEPYAIASMVLLAGGGWAYLRAGQLWQRVVALLIGLTLAMTVIALGKMILFSSPDWPYPRYHFTWQSELLSTVSLWLWLVGLVCAPLLLTLLPRPHRASQAEL